MTESPEVTDVFEVRMLNETTAVDEFDALSDEELQDVATRANGILKKRVTERRKSAIDEIRRLARENGLTVSVKQPSRKRGRPAKTNSPKAKGKEST